jgi:hypothetical protein
MSPKNHLASLALAATCAMAVNPTIGWSDTRPYDSSGDPGGHASRPATAMSGTTRDREQREREQMRQWLREFDGKYQDLYAGKDTASDYGANDFPTKLVSEIAPAKANAAAARAQHRRSYADLNRAIRWELEDFKNDPKLKAALAEQDQAYEAFQAARGKVIGEIANDPTYQAAVSLRDDLGNDIESLHSQRTKDEEQIIAVASVKLMHASVARDLEAAALAASEEVQAARQRLVTATANVLELRNEFNRGLRGNAEVQTARNTFEDSRIARLAADAYLVGAIEAAGAAIDYAYYVHRYDQYRYVNYVPAYDYYDNDYRYRLRY